MISQNSKIIECNFAESTNVWNYAFCRRVRAKEHVSIGDNSRIEDSTFDDYVNIQRNNLIYNSKIGRYTYTGRNFNCWYAVIGSFCSISWNVSIGGANHDYRRLTTSAFLYSDIFDLKGDNPSAYDRFTENCVIGNDVWVGAGAIIGRNITIGDGAVIAAGAVVTRDVEPYSIVAGVPAKRIKYRFDKTIREALLDLKWWNLPIQKIKDNFHVFKEEPNIDIINFLRRLK